MFETKGNLVLFQVLSKTEMIVLPTDVNSSTRLQSTALNSFQSLLGDSLFKYIREPAGPDQVTPLVSAALHKMYAMKITFKFNLGIGRDLLLMVTESFPYLYPRLSQKPRMKITLIF